MRLIDANELVEDIRALPASLYPNIYEDLVDEALTVDAVLARYAHWNILNSEECQCSSCGNERLYDHMITDKMPNYCDNCGAKMEEED